MLGKASTGDGQGDRHIKTFDRKKDDDAYRPFTNDLAAENSAPEGFFLLTPADFYAT